MATQLQHHDSLTSEKQVVDHVEHKVPYGDLEASQNHHEDIDSGFDPTFAKKTMRKVDWRLIPILSAMYCVSLIDRTNISLARQGNKMKMDRPTELNTGVGNHYSIVTIVFFVPYIILELPSQLGLRKFGARIWLSTAVLCWGVVMIGMGFVTSWQQLAGLRALLGVFEAALFPGAAYLISCWYPRHSMASRNVIFYITSSVVGSFSAPLGYCMTLLDGHRGLSGWQWVFCIYGIITCVVALIAFVFLVDLPHKATFITEEERTFIQTRIERDRKDSVPDPITVAKVLKYCCDLKIWLYGFMFMSTTLAAYSLAYFQPVILATIGFNNVETQVLGAPISAWSLIPSLISARIADKYRHCRAWVIVFNAIVLIIGTSMYSQLPMKQKAARFVGVFLASGACASNVPLVVSWAQTSIRSQSKRAVSSALIIAWGGIGGILSGVVMIQKEAKRGYPTGIYFTMAVNAATVFFATGLHLWFRYQNKRADRGQVVLEEDDEFRYQG